MSGEESVSTPSAAARYSSLLSKRDPVLRRARECALLTIPALMPPEGAKESARFVTPYQAVGARGVNNLASKMLLALLPTNSSFFRYEIDDFALEELTQQEGLRAQVEDALGKMERAINSEIESSCLRTVGFEAFKQLVNSGNVLLYAPRNGGDPRMFRLDKYVVRRSPSGKPLETIIREDVSVVALEPDIVALLPEDLQAKHAKGDASSTTHLYTVVCYCKGKYEAHQEINGHHIPGTEATYPEDECPYMPLRFIRVDGEDYGRGYVEEYYGDLKSLEGLEKSILFGAAASAKVLFLVNPNGQTRLKDVAEAEPGAVKSGLANDISVMEMNKAGDFRVALEKAASLERRLAQAFLMNTSIQRSGERVTAEEIRFMAQELEDALGGIYSLLAQEFQRPLVAIMGARLRKKRRLPRLPKGAVQPVIVTGLEALGRGRDLQRLDEFINGIPAPLQQAAMQRINIGDYLTRRAVALSLDQKGLIKSDQVVQQEQQAAAQAQMAQAVVDKGTGPAIGALANAAQPPQ